MVTHQCFLQLSILDTWKSLNNVLAQFSPLAGLRDCRANTSILPKGTGQKTLLQHRWNPIPLQAFTHCTFQCLTGKNHHLSDTLYSSSSFKLGSNPCSCSTAPSYAPEFCGGFFFANFPRAPRCSGTFPNLHVTCFQSQSPAHQDYTTHPFLRSEYGLQWSSAPGNHPTRVLVSAWRETWCHHLHPILVLWSGQKNYGTHCKQDKHNVEEHIMQPTFTHCTLYIPLDPDVQQQRNT